jgi:hypothetical protein
VHPITFIVGLIAIIIFCVEYGRSRSLLAVGLAVLTATLMLAFLLGGEDVFYIIE